MRLRRSVFQALIHTFERFGYEPLETPAVELTSILLGKYGEEGDKLLFRILNSGDFLAEAPPEARTRSATLLPYISEKALRYDLTVPMARWVAQHAGELVFPFKRYQIQPVWRADRPQRGRFREFYQCDIDIVGAEGIMPLLEIAAILRESLNTLQLTGAVLHLNHRALLEKACHETGWPKEDFVSFCGLLDKSDKIGWTAVQQQFAELGFTLPEWLDPATPWPLLREQLSLVEGLAADLSTLESLLADPTPPVSLRWDATLARGLSYYTGYIYELRMPESGLGSIGAGGAYASLVGDFGGPDLPAMGFSFGIERILLLVSEALSSEPPSQALVAWIDASPSYAMRVVQALQSQGLSAFAYPSPKKLSKQLDYAQRRGIRWVAIVGSQEEATQTLQLRDLQHHTQKTLALHELAQVAME